MGRGGGGGGCLFQQLRRAWDGTGAENERAEAAAWLESTGEWVHGFELSHTPVHCHGSVGAGRGGRHTTLPR